MVHWLDNAIYKLEKENRQKICFLNKAMLFACMIIFILILFIILVWDDTFFWSSFYFIYVNLNVKTMSCKNPRLITLQKLSSAGSAWMDLALFPLVCVWHRGWYATT
jgi:hypothetical protein